MKELERNFLGQEVPIEITGSEDVCKPPAITTDWKKIQRAWEDGPQTLIEERAHLGRS